jgi:hypothetical protein
VREPAQVPVGVRVRRQRDGVCCVIHVRASASRRSNSGSASLKR